MTRDDRLPRTEPAIPVQDSDTAFCTVAFRGREEIQEVEAGKVRVCSTAQSQTPGNRDL